MGPEVLVPIIAMLTMFGMPVGIVFVIRHFRFKEHELQLERHLDADERQERLEARLERIEKLLGSVQAELRALPPAPKAELYLPPHRDEKKD